ncbi:WRKY transcription factor 28-like [Phoenix dactylifera]|uniref:WRKY transcription factor 28-like n=1 Tax=Phoenix dactylifera TaxID=42345 RepID=A0A8B7BHZ0_PHODC|nr:WRKY transcription factor 28-like [Phoenix dactylifera]
MSGENRELYHHGHHFLRDRGDLPFHDDLSSFLSQRPSGATLHDLQGHDLQAPSPYMSFTDYLHGSSDYGLLAKAFDMSYPSPELLGPRDGGAVKQELVVDTNITANLNVSTGGGGGGGTTPATPNSSVSSSSTEAQGEEDSGRWKKDQQKVQEEEEKQQIKEGEDGGDKTKKVNKPRKRGEKRQRAPRFAFMTRSEVDHLEDGYRWRKYGQKAVKNSPYPRSYYRCTTQKCSVKKRVERSYQDPTIVITTYEGQHTHQSPATIRGSTHILAPPPTVPTSFRQDLLIHHQMPQLNAGSQQMQGDANPNVYLPTLPTPLQQLQFPDYGLLQDIVPSFIHNKQP